MQSLLLLPLIHGSLLLSAIMLFASVEAFVVPLQHKHQGQQFQASSSSALFARGPRRNSQKQNVKEVKPTMNDEITATELRVVIPTSGGKDEALGIMSRNDALQKAQDMSLDLIMINDKSDPPVCKIVDYSKYRYMQEKKAKEIKKNSKASEIKEVKMSYKIDTHDYDVRKKNALKFLQQGNRVKCTVMFRGREMQHDQLGYDLLDKLAQDLQDVCTKEGKVKREFRNLSLILGPRPELLKAVNENRRAEERLKKQKKAAAKQQAAANKATTVEQAEATVAVLKEEEEEVDDDEELSLDELLGSDDLTDKLFG